MTLDPLLSNNHAFISPLVEMENKNCITIKRMIINMLICMGEKKGQHIDYVLT